MKFGKYLADTRVPEWSSAYVDYKSLKKFITQQNFRNDSLFIEELQKELEKNKTFFIHECSTLSGRYEYLDTTLTDNLESIAQNGFTAHLRKRFKNVKFLLREFHSYCTFLENFQKLNKIAFSKIIKKYDKKFDSDLLESTLVLFIENEMFKDERPAFFCKCSENALINLFRSLPENAKNNVTPRSIAMKYLRGVDKNKSEFSFFRVGLCIGLSIPVFTLSLIRIFEYLLYTKLLWIKVLYIYGGLFILVLLFFGISLDLYVWRRYRVNYVFIFELGRNDGLTYKQFTEFAALSFFLWSTCLYFTVHETFQFFLSFQYIPLLLVGLYIFILIIPFPFFYRSSRIWFMKTLFRVFTSGFRNVHFKDFFIADLLTSLTFFWTSIYMTVCFYSSSTPEVCSPGTSILTPFLISTPFFIRAIQCIRKYFDCKEKRDIYNTVKYLVSIAAIFASSFNNISKKGSTLFLWISIATISALYSYIWDLKVDWNVSANNKLIKKKWLYVAVIGNFFLRFNWILAINTFLLFDLSFFAFIAGCFEVFRRSIWAIFRVELEHTHNAEHYRAVLEIPLLDIIDKDDVEDGTATTDIIS